VQYTYTVFASIPDILLLIALVLVLGRGLPQICLALGATSWIGLCRLVRGETLKHRDREYVRAAKALGASNGRLLIHHILPNLLPVVMISVVLGFSSFILYEAILSYLGVGVGEDVGSWGNMIDSARTELSRDPVIWWNLVSATVAMFGLVLSLNIFGDALRDAIDPRLRSS
jgi:peptide/nickel transport system permease protein